VLCIRPLKRPRQEFGCGQCLPCRINRRREWTARIALESLAFRESSFVTLTYSDEHLPANNSLSNADWRAFTKGIGVRYFGVGEYGERTHRPHYHLVLFDTSAAAAHDLCATRWQKGFFSVRPFVFEHAAYVASYVVKKLTKVGDERLELGQLPEFARMSRRPGIGVSGLGAWLDFYRSGRGRSLASGDLDVSSFSRIGGRSFPVGRYLRDRLRDAAAVPSDDPRRTWRRESAYRAQQASPEFVKAREAKRVCQYEHLKAREARRKGVL